MAISSSNYMAPNYYTAGNELERTWKEVWRAKFKVPGMTNPQKQADRM